jgi:hypothetical protein
MATAWENYAAVLLIAPLLASAQPRVVVKKLADNKVQATCPKETDADVSLALPTSNPNIVRAFVTCRNAGGILARKNFYYSSHGWGMIEPPTPATDNVAIFSTSSKLVEARF